MLIFCLEKEDQSPCQDGIEGALEESRLQNAFADDRHAGQIALECCNKRWRCIYTADMKSFIDQYRRQGEAGSAA